MMNRALPELLVALIATLWVLGGAHAQDAAKPPPAAAPTDKAAEPAGRTQWLDKADASKGIPDEVALNILIRRTLLTVNDANLSGNYTVLRDLAAPSFQSKNDPKKLAEVFAKFRSSNIDLAPIVYFAPRLTRKPELKDGMLRLTGFMPTKPQQINFDMVFEQSGGRWRLDAIAVNAVPAQATAASPAPADAAAKTDAAKKK
jgi:hypothetical protein